MVLQLSGLNAALISEALNDDYRGHAANVYLVILDSAPVITTVSYPTLEWETNIAHGTLRYSRGPIDRCTIDQVSPASVLR